MVLLRHRILVRIGVRSSILVWLRVGRPSGVPSTAVRPEGGRVVLTIFSPKIIAGVPLLLLLFPIMSRRSPSCVAAALISSGEVEPDFLIFVELVKEPVESHVLGRLIDIPLEFGIEAVVEKEELVVNIIHFS